MNFVRKFTKCSFKSMKIFHEHKNQSDHDEKWATLYRERQQNCIYKWLNLKTEGNLYDIYDTEGIDGIVRFATENISVLLYNDGKKPEAIQYSELLKWKQSMPDYVRRKEKILQRQKSVFVERNAQWRLCKRGIDGETLIHLLVNRADAKSNKIALILMDMFPGLVLDVYECDELQGQSSLHLAIVQENYECVEFLLEKGANVNQRAIGLFFWPEDQKSLSPKKQTNFEGYAYYGEYPLAFAASFGNKDIYDTLIRYGANPNSQDSFGNTILHICVINNSIEMYSYAVKHWERPADVQVVNKFGDTPLTLATKLGRKKIFEEMLELMKVEFWRFRDMAYSAYPLTTLDTIRPDGTTNWDSALMTIIHGNTTEHMEMIGSEVVQRLLTEKWKIYAFKKFCERLLFLMLHLLCMSVGVYLRSTQNPNGMYSAQDYVRFTCEIITCLCSAAFVFVVQGKEFKAEGIYGFLKNLPAAPEKGIFLFVNILILLCIPLRILNLRDVEDAFLVIALPGSWMFLLFFARAGALTGPFVEIIFRMIAGDIMRFAIISLVFFMGFSQAFHFMAKDVQERQKYNHCDKTDPIVSYETFLETIVTLLRASMGGYEYDDFECVRYVRLMKIASVVFMFFMPIMLVNMLIAMMGNTYNMIISQAEKASKQQWARIVILLERAHSKEKLAIYQERYSIEISRDEDTGSVTRGLMVIVQTKKTKTAQRNSAVASWKRIFRKVLQDIRMFKMAEMKEQETIAQSAVTEDDKVTSHDIKHLETEGNVTTIRQVVEAFTSAAADADMHHIDVNPDVAAYLLSAPNANAPNAFLGGETGEGLEDLDYYTLESAPGTVALNNTCIPVEEPLPERIVSAKYKVKTPKNLPPADQQNHHYLHLHFPNLPNPMHRVVFKRKHPETEKKGT